jgi:hypothetical protein
MSTSRATYNNQFPALSIGYAVPPTVIDSTDHAFWPWYFSNGPRRLQPRADAHLAEAVAFTGGFPDEVFTTKPIEAEAY